MVDLYGQYEKIKDEINDAIQQVINQSSFIKGNDVKLFEKELSEYLGCKHVIACANGTDALQIAMMALNLKPGDEIITPDFTFISTVEVNAVLGLIPILTDVDEKTFTLDINAVRKAVSPKTKAIVPVHLYGQCACMDEILSIAKENGLYVIEDTAQAIGAEYTLKSDQIKKASTMGHIGCISFFPSKNLGCYGDGGAINTNNDELAETIRCIANHGMKEKYYHETIGVNSRLDTIQAAILRVKLKYLDKYNKARQQVADYYDKAFAGISQIEVPFRNPNSTHVFHQYTVKLENGIDRNDFRNYLNSHGIPSMVYYPVSMHSQKAYTYLNQKDDEFPVTNNLVNRVISLPMHTELDEEQLIYITEKIKAYLN